MSSSDDFSGNDGFSGNNNFPGKNNMPACESFSGDGSGDSLAPLSPDSSQEVMVFDSSSNILTVRGTEDGLVFRIDGRADWGEITSDVETFVEGKKNFLRGGQVAIEWLDKLPTKEQRTQLETMLVETCEVDLVSKKPKPDVAPTKACVVERGGKTIPLFEVPKDGVEPSMEESPDELAKDILSSVTGGGGYLERMERILGEDVLYEDDSNCKAVFGTLRSGQRIETPFTLLVVGDVNPGADLVAGGDIIVMGRLSGTAHAAAYDEHATDRVIVALHMAPIQLRIGSVISRGSDEAGEEAEVARIEDRRIIVETFNAKRSLGHRLRA